MGYWPLFLFLAAWAPVARPLWGQVTAQQPGTEEAGLPPATTSVQAPDSSADTLKAVPDSVAGYGQGGWDLLNDDTATTAIRYQADLIDYRLDLSLISLTGRAEVRYKEIKVTGDSISLDTKNQMLTVDQNPVLYDGNEAIKGDRMVYDFKARLGWIYNGITDFNRGRYWGRRIRQVDDRVLNIDYGRYTTCDCDTPHFYFWSRQMKIYLNDKIVAQPVLLCFKGIPVLAIPFWFFPMRKERHSGFLMPRFGSNNYEGAFVKNLAYYQVMGGQSDATASADFLEKVGWRGNFEARYMMPPRFSTTLNFSYQNDRNTGYRRWSLNGLYSQMLGKRTNINGNANFVSDRNYYTDFSDNRAVRMDRNLHSYLAINTPLSTIASLTGAVDHYNNLETSTKSSRLPDVTVSLYRKDIIKGLLGFSGSSHFLATDKRDTLMTEKHQGWENRMDLSSAFNIFRWINVNPGLHLSGTWYDRDTSQNRNVLRWLYSEGMGASTTLYGLLNIKGGKLQALRHVVKPQVLFSYSPKIDQGRFYGFLGGGQGESKTMGLSLSQQFQAKYKKDTTEQKVDLLTISSGTSYNFLATGEKWGSLTSSLQLLPYASPLDCQFSWEYNFYQKRNQWARLDIGYNLSGKWLGWLEPKDSTEALIPAPDSTAISTQTDSLAQSAALPADTLIADSLGTVSNTAAPAPKPAKGLPWSISLGFGQNWQKNMGVTGSDLTGSANFNLTRNWSISYRRYYNIKTGEMISQDYSLFRDLHCWEARFSSSKSRDKWSYMFVIRLKAIPEVKLETKSGRVVGYQ
ncbi:LPS-assembly protein LptD [candidate division TA06 bacterium]|uniref:LPS-assembly protein LptD n=1 Tax=candidate division TA06 bacterium TaxID=2250710 RepID=A0A933I9F1_UNCT6|nr:LPS-assembly protein LptD [candidate division TA06 bacterium]